MATDAYINSPDGTEIPVSIFQYSGARDVILFLPALGMRKDYYVELAKNFQSFGVNTVLLEQRGHGLSKEQPSRDSKFGYRDYALNDVMAVLDYLNWEMPQCKVHLMGHSLGGHIAVTLKALRPDLVGNMILIGCGTPFHAVLGTKRSWQVLFLTSLIPGLLKIFGYFPGNLVGFGGKEFPILMRDWMSLAKFNKFDFFGVGRDLDKAIATMNGRVLCVSLTDDDMAPISSSKALLNKMKNCKISLINYTSSQLGGRSDHFTWVKNSFKISKDIKDWITKKEVSETEEPDKAAARPAAKPKAAPKK